MERLVFDTLGEPNDPHSSSRLACLFARILRQGGDASFIDGYNREVLAVRALNAIDTLATAEIGDGYKDFSYFLREWRNVEHN